MKINQQHLIHILNVKILLKIVLQQELVVLLFLNAQHIQINQFAMLLHQVKMVYKDASGTAYLKLVEIKRVMIYKHISMLNAKHLI